MAANQISISPVEVCQKRYEYGHHIVSNIVLNNLAATQQEWNFESNYSTDCQMSPISFHFLLTFQRLPGSIGFSCFALLKRYGCLNENVKVTFGLRFSNRENFFFDYIPWPIEKEGSIRPGEEKRAVLNKVVEPRFQYVLHEELFVSVDLSVQNCHNEISEDLEKIEAAAAKGRTYISKM